MYAHIYYIKLLCQIQIKSGYQCLPFELSNDQEMQKRVFAREII